MNCFTTPCRSFIFSSYCLQAINTVLKRLKLSSSGSRLRILTPSFLCFAHLFFLRDQPAGEHRLCSYPRSVKEGNKRYQRQAAGQEPEERRSPMRRKVSIPKRTSSVLSGAASQ